MRVLGIKPLNVKDEQKRRLFAQLYENPGMRMYLDEREQFIKDLIADMIVTGNTPESIFYGGRLLELQEMKIQMRDAHARVTKERELKKESKTSS